MATVIFLAPPSPVATNQQDYQYQNVYATPGYLGHQGLKITQSGAGVILSGSSYSYGNLIAKTEGDFVLSAPGSDGEYNLTYATGLGFVWSTTDGEYSIEANAFMSGNTRIFTIFGEFTGGTLTLLGEYLRPKAGTEMRLWGSP